MLKDSVSTRQSQYTVQIGKLAYERLQLMRRVDEIDKLISQLEGAQSENTQSLKDIQTQEAIDKAQKEAAEKKAADAEQPKN
ncbi:MAG: hypothetical protein PHU08_00205 [Dehalococcoidales bacterium]|nr:hypothetical protein [Dehalococcoidales bacterium]